MERKNHPLPSISESAEAQLASALVLEEEKYEEQTGGNNGTEESSLQAEKFSLWNQDGWELTWPIWHLLPHDERKRLAHMHGYKTIGDFEEYMSLYQAMDDSAYTKPYANDLIYPEEKKPSAAKKDSKPAADSKRINARENGDDDDDDEQEEDDGDDDSDSERKKNYTKQRSTVTDDLSYEELLQVGGQILMLHDEILHQVFAWLPVDVYATLARVSPHWKIITRTEAVYKRLCERLYLNQSKRRQLHVSRFGGSYRTMLEERPRVRAAGGCYILKYAQVKQIQRDMWTEVPVGAILESIYYRYLYFQEDGRVLYALTSAPPHTMFPRLLKVCLRKQEDPAAVWGTFEVQKNMLTITARQPWHTIKFELSIETSSIHGRFGALTLNRHFSSPSASFEDWSHDRVKYKVPNEHFRFVKSSFL